jgi:hypothetical protein
MLTTLFTGTFPAAHHFSHCERHSLDQDDITRTYAGDWPSNFCASRTHEQLQHVDDPRKYRVWPALKVGAHREIYWGFRVDDIYYSRNRTWDFFNWFPFRLFPLLSYLFGFGFELVPYTGNASIS